MQEYSDRKNNFQMQLASWFKAKSVNQVLENPLTTFSFKVEHKETKSEKPMQISPIKF